MGSLDRLRAAKRPGPKCVCQKEIFYSAEAAWAAIRQMTARRLIQYGCEAERDVYECPQVPGAGVYHLTSNRGYEPNEVVKAIRSERAKASEK